MNAYALLRGEATQQRRGSCGKVRRVVVPQAGFAGRCGGASQPPVQLRGRVGWAGIDLWTWQHNDSWGHRGEGIWRSSEREGHGPAPGGYSWVLLTRI